MAKKTKEKKNKKQEGSKDEMITDTKAGEPDAPLVLDSKAHNITAVDCDDPTCKFHGSPHRHSHLGEKEQPVVAAPADESRSGEREDPSCRLASLPDRPETVAPPNAPLQDDDNVQCEPGEPTTTPKCCCGEVLVPTDDGYFFPCTACEIKYQLPPNIRGLLSCSLPVGVRPEGQYVGRHVDFQLTIAQSELLLDIGAGLRDCGEHHSNGQIVAKVTDVFRYILQTLLERPCEPLDVRRVVTHRLPTPKFLIGFDRYHACHGKRDACDKCGGSGVEPVTGKGIRDGKEG